MLEEAFEFAKEQHFTYSWHDTDYEFLTRLNNLPSTRENVRESLFTLNVDLSKSLTEHILSDEVYTEFTQEGHALSSKAIVEETANGWKIVDNTKVYLIEKGNGALEVYKIVPRAFEISATVRRLMIGDLYGCIGIFSSSKIENRSLFKDQYKRRAMENRASEIIRELKGRFSKAIIVFHLIEDINKTERKINIRTSNGSMHEIGHSLNRLLIGAFFRNQQLSMHNLNYPNEMERVRSNINKYLSSVLTDEGLIEIPMYEEAGMYTEST
jgi:hypothetical protein